MMDQSDVNNAIDKAIQRERERTILMVRNAAHQARRWAVKESLRFLADLLESDHEAFASVHDEPGTDADQA